MNIHATSRLYKEQLKAMVDHYGLSSVVQMLAEVCRDKANSMATNWQDYDAADTWVKASTALRSADNDAIRSVST